MASRLLRLRPTPLRPTRRPLVGALLTSALILATACTSAGSNASGPGSTAAGSPGSTGFTTTTWVPPTTPPTTGAAPTTAPPSTTGDGSGSGGGEPRDAIRTTDFANLTFPADTCDPLYPTPPPGGLPLRGGTARQGSPGRPAFYDVTLRPNISWGDLNGDQRDDAVLVFDCVAGNRPVSVAWVYTRGSGVGSGATPMTPVRIDAAQLDALGRPTIQLLEVSIVDGRLVSRWAAFYSGDPVCCPSRVLTITQRWTSSALAVEGTPRNDAA